jgi:histone H3/H4
MAMAKSYVVASRIQQLAGKQKMRLSSKAIMILDSRIEELLKEAAKRAKGNGRKTIMPYDL